LAWGAIEGQKERAMGSESDLRDLYTFMKTRIMKPIKVIIKNRGSQALVAQAYSPSYSGDRDQEDCSLKPTWGNCSRDPILKKQFTKKGAW
jgi:hypothetical protein